MSRDFLADSIGSVGRARVLRALVSNEGRELTAAVVSRVSGVSKPGAARELASLATLGVARKIKIKSGKGAAKGGPVSDTWTLNENFKHVRLLAEFVRGTSTAEFRAVERALRAAGRLSIVVLSGAFMGDHTRPTDLLIAGDRLNERRLSEAIGSIEKDVGWEIRYAVFSTPELRYRLTVEDRLLRETLDFPHKILVNRGGLINTH